MPALLPSPFNELGQEVAHVQVVAWVKINIQICVDVATGKDVVTGVGSTTQIEITKVVVIGFKALKTNIHTDIDFRRAGRVVCRGRRACVVCTVGACNVACVTVGVGISIGIVAGGGIRAGVTVGVRTVVGRRIRVPVGAIASIGRWCCRWTRYLQLSLEFVAIIVRVPVLGPILVIVSIVVVRYHSGSRYHSNCGLLQRRLLRLRLRRLRVEPGRC